jgi:hypothetical protein
MCSAHGAWVSFRLLFFPNYEWQPFHALHVMVASLKHMAAGALAVISPLYSIGSIPGLFFVVACSEHYSASPGLNMIGTRVLGFVGALKKPFIAGS